MSLQEESIKSLALLLADKRRRENREEGNKKTLTIKDILIFLTVFGVCVFAPNSLSVLKPLIIKPKDFDYWKKFNKRRLKWTLKRLKKEKIVEIQEKNNETLISITQNGHKRILKYAIEDLQIIKPDKWDGKWRFVLYDIPKSKKNLANKLRRHLQGYGFTALQESVYLFPYPCNKEIEFIRSYYNLNREIKLITAFKIEDEEAYKEYFGLS